MYLLAGLGFRKSTGLPITIEGTRRNGNLILGCATEEKDVASINHDVGALEHGHDVRGLSSEWEHRGNDVKEILVLHVKDESCAKILC